MSYFGDPVIERVPLTRRKNRLYLKGVKTAASTKLAPFDLGHYPPDEWRKALRRHASASTDARRLGQRKAPPRTSGPRLSGYWVPPWRTLRIHRCAECKTAWYVAHYAVRRCDACEREHRQDRIHASNAVMIARRAEQRAAARTGMVCESCGEAMTGGRLRSYCSQACRQAAYRERQQM
jgi:hypothetical protein